MQHSHGNSTDILVERTSQIVGNLSLELDEMFQSVMGESHFGRSKTDNWEYKKQVLELVEEYRSDCLFDYISGRTFQNVPG